MVKDSLWERFGVGNGMLCLQCLEQRMKRKLLKADFTGAPINDSLFGQHKGRFFPLNTLLV